MYINLRLFPSRVWIFHVTTMTVPESTVCCLHFDKDNERLADKQTKNIVFLVACSELYSALSKRLTHSLWFNTVVILQLSRDGPIHPIPPPFIVHLPPIIVRAIRSDCPLPCFNTPVLQFYSSLSIWLSFIIVLLLPCDLSWTYFPAKVIGCSNLANAGVPLRVSRKNILLRLSSVFFRISLVRLFPPPFGGRKINPKGRKQAEKREKKKG